MKTYQQDMFNMPLDSISCKVKKQNTNHTSLIKVTISIY